MKTKFSKDSYGRVTVEYDCAFTGDRVSRTFTCAQEGGYVWELLKGGDRQQVCDRLGSRGSTLAAASIETLPALIRGEYRAMRRAEKRNQS